MECQIESTEKYLSVEICQGHIKKCPNGCLVEKLDGCNYLECGCGVKWCWNCGGVKGIDCMYGSGCNSH